jgi:hypothetical protein
MLTVTLKNVDAARAVIARGGPPTEPERAAMAAELVRLVQRHLRARDDSNAHTYPEGGRRSRFWRKAAQSVFFQLLPQEIVVRVAHLGARLRYTGGKVVPVNAKALALPANGTAYGRSPREFPDLRLVVFKSKNRAALVQKAGPGEALGRVMFWLLRSVTHRPDATVLPPPNVVTGLALYRLKTMRGIAP